MLLGQLGLGHDHHGHHLLPVGTVYDPFVLRGLDALIYGALQRRPVRGRRHPGRGHARPRGRRPPVDDHRIGRRRAARTSTYAEPAFATEVDWLLCDALDQLSPPDGRARYLRLSTRPIDQAPFAAALERVGEDALRRQVLAGGYRLRRSRRRPTAGPGSPS